LRKILKYLYPLAYKAGFKAGMRYERCNQLPISTKDDLIIRSVEAAMGEITEEQWTAFLERVDGNTGGETPDAK
jgi:hypothetical protein